ncbi:hypothetical protein QEN19_002114 [Hanseniaspora menglaensis]
MPQTLLPGNTRCFPLELPSTNLDEYGFFSYYDPNTQPCSYQQVLYRKKYFLTERIGAATTISRSSIVVHGGLVLDIVDELMTEYATANALSETVENSTGENEKRTYALTSTNIHNAWLRKVLEDIEDSEHNQALNDDDHFQNHSHAISDCLSNQFFQLDLLSRRWQHVPTFLEDYGPLLKPRMCQDILGDSEFFYLYGGLIPMNRSEMRNCHPITSSKTNESELSNSSATSHINEDQLLLATNELWRLDVTSKIFICLNDELDNSNIPERYNHYTVLSTFIERFEVLRDDNSEQNPNDNIPVLSPYGKKIKVGEKFYIEKPVKKLIILGGLGIDDKEIFKVDVFNLETNKWESGIDGLYKNMYLDFAVNKEYETAVAIDNPLTGYSSIVVYKKNELSPLKVIPLLSKNTYDLNLEIISDVHDTNLDEYFKEGLTDHFPIQTNGFDKKLHSFNRNLLHAKMKIFGPNLLVSGYVNKNDKSLILTSVNETESEKNVSTQNNDVLACLDKTCESSLNYKSFCFNLINGKWIEINTDCVDVFRCSHHMISDSFVWSSHHKLLFMGSIDYTKVQKTSPANMNLISPILQKFDHIVSTGLTLTSLFNKNSLLANEDTSFAKARQLFFSSQDHNYTLLNYINSSPADEFAGITNLDVKRFKEFAEYSAPLSTLTANKSIMPPYSMLLGKTLFVECGEQVSDFEIIPAEGPPILCSMTVLRKRWGRYFNSLLAHAYIESVHEFDDISVSNDPSKFSSISSIAKSRKHSSIPSSFKDKTKTLTTQSALKNSLTANLFSESQVLPMDTKKYTDQRSSIDAEFATIFNKDQKDEISPNDISTDILGSTAENIKKNSKDEFFKNSFYLNSQEHVELPDEVNTEEEDVDIAGSPLSKHLSHEGYLNSKRGSISSRLTQETVASKPQTLTSSSNGMVFRVPFQNSTEYNLADTSVNKISANRYHPRSGSISSQVKRLSETRKRSLTPLHNISDTPHLSRSHSIISETSKRISFILPDIDLDALPAISSKPAFIPDPPIKSRVEHNHIQILIKEPTTSPNQHGSTTFAARRRSSAAADLTSQKEFLRNSPMLTAESYGRRGSAISATSDTEKKTYQTSPETHVSNINKSSFSTIHDYPSKPGSIASSVRSHSAETDESGESIINTELEPLMIPRSLYLPWSSESVTAFTEFFYTGQINPKWPLQPVALDIFAMSKLYEVPLLYDIMTEVFYSIIGRKEEYVFSVKEKVASKYKAIVKRYLNAMHSDQPLEDFLSHSKPYSTFQKLDDSLQNINDGYCDYFLLKQASKAVDFDEDSLQDVSSFSNYKKAPVKRPLPDSFANNLNTPNYPVTPAKYLDFKNNSIDSTAQYVPSEYSGVSPKSSFSKNISGGLDLKISAMKKNSLQKFQGFQSENFPVQHLESDQQSQYSDSFEILRYDSNSPKSSTFNIKSNTSIPLSSVNIEASFSNQSSNNDIAFTDLNDLITSDYDMSTSSSSSGSDSEYDSRPEGSVSGKSDFSNNSKASKDKYGFGLLSPAKVNEKVEEFYLEEPNEYIEFWIGKDFNENIRKSKKSSKDKDHSTAVKDEAKKISKAAASLTLEQLAANFSRHPVEFVIQMIYDVATSAYDLMLLMRARNCLEMCKMYKAVLKDMREEITLMEAKIADIRLQQQENQKAQLAHHMNQSSTNVSSTPQQIIKKPTIVRNDSMKPPSAVETTSFASSKGKQVISDLGMIPIDLEAKHIQETDSEADKKSVNSSVGSSFSRSTASKKKSVLNNVKQMKPKRSMSILNLFKRSSNEK